jgi:hypothetical protein
MVCRCVDQTSGCAQNSPIGAVSSSSSMIAEAGQLGMIFIGWPLADRAFNAGLRRDSASRALYFLAFASTMVVTRPLPMS